MSEKTAAAPRARKRSPLFALWLVPAVPLAIAALCWLLLTVHPETGSGTVSGRRSGVFDVSAPMERIFTGSEAEALQALTTAGDGETPLPVIRKVYTIPEDALTAPQPDPARFGETDDPAVVQAVVESAAELLDGQELCWSPDIERMEGTLIKYYCDETILVICWKEGIGHYAASFMEIKLADGSQIRRALSGGSYGSSVHTRASDMARSVNAVAAINGDFYDYRRLGITVYQRKVYRVEPARVESAFFTASGDMIFSHMGELAGEGEAQRFVDENDVVFGIAFGPILVENGELRQVPDYPVGEPNAQYSRSVIAQKDTLHYLLMTLGQEGRYTHRTTVNETAQIILARGVRNAYTLDGGQTATLVFHGATFNRVDWDNERTMSDIIYFATAIPEEEWQT